ncbi:hypothetical protein KKR91_05290 [Arthrobacter jiangjiafuii]|uniref:Uncharacterized protein n=1 Tax=Arthrobacter jiangjiafuii TaxID=2817475 RepID=A0A975R186_9MICC|nr:hypothetical protein [Arthrobacter jiangjiafuii]MBP3044022.1 hypothetical protein [Arthrobacter jiangjiafuii]QWC11012.1 hypothetical protein KKR91_05290 [Arthrobacter jiangjiafuii]
MREWIWRHRAVVFPLAALLATAAVLLILRANGTPWQMAVFFTLFNSLWWFGLLYLYLRRDQTRKSALEKQGTLVYLRYPGSQPGSLQDRWAGGIAASRPGKILFQEVMSGTDVTLGSPTEIDVLDRAGPPRPVTGDVAHQLPPGLKVLTFAMVHGTVEIAAEPLALATLEQHVLQSGPMAS